ncbi:O-antigen ligase family protein [Comamonas testosteroni]|nr:O-antigen ligase family protein [Comamonas testosteroni]QQN71098.1 hypothetical protein IYN88_06755 [Comamonas testosteroni]
MKYLQVAIKTFFVIFLLGAFLLPGKYSFWPEFHQSASAICVAIISSIALIFYKRIAINHFSIILFFFCIAIVFDLFLERNYFFAFNFYGLLYLLAAIFLSIYCINNEDDSLYYIFSVSLIFISLVSFLLQIYQITGWWVDYQLIINYLDENDNRAYANIGQPNLLGTLYVVSIIVSLVNFSQKKINGKILSLLIFIFSLGVYLTASRVAMLSLFLVSIFLLGQEKFRANPISVALPSALIIIFFSKFSIPFLFSLEERSLISSNFSNGRFEIWRMALSQVGKNLSTGYGFNRFGLASFYNLDTFPYLENTFVTQSHNLFIDLFIWFGIPIGIILSVAIFIFIFIFVKENFSFKDRNFLYIASFPVLIHAIFEYPLYYQNFLSIFAIIIGL